MGAISQLMDLARDHGYATDVALAERLGRSKQIASQWRAGTKYPEDETVLEMARIAGQDPGVWLLRIQAERASGAAGRAWAALAKRLGAAAALGFLAMGLTPSPAVAQVVDSAAQIPSNVYYVNWRTIVRRILRGLRSQRLALTPSPA